MKRKVKLFSAIASLCLAVALMAFGVYAATQVTYSVSGTVAYEMKDVMVTIDATVEYVKDHKTPYAATAVATAATAGEFTTAKTSALEPADITIAQFKSYEGTNLKNPGTTLTQANSDINVDFNASTLWRIKIKVTNDDVEGGKAVKVTPVVNNSSSDAFSVVGYEATSYESGYTNVVIEPEQNHELVFYIFLVKNTAKLDGVAYSITLTIEQNQGA